LEQIRADIFNNDDLEKWLHMSFKVEKDLHMVPMIELEVRKDDKKVETVVLLEKSYYYLGQYKKNDVFLAHPSVSRRHAVIFVNQQYEVCLMDLGSKSGKLVIIIKLGTLLNGQYLE
jgi:pSer/pThr/pTyr-binding forkhead associated (FHA) protein